MTSTTDTNQHGEANRVANSRTIDLSDHALTGATAWRWASLAVGFAFALLHVYWQLTDHAPPRWDESVYLTNAWTEWNAALHGGPRELYHAFLTTDAGRPGLLALIALPAFLLFKPSLDAAVLSFAPLWIIAAWSLHDFTFNAGRLLLRLDPRQSASAGFFACVLFAVFPPIQNDSHWFLVEFPLIVAVTVLNACALRFWMTGSVWWALATGAALAAGLLVKVTFPAFTIAAAGLVVWRFYEDRSVASICKAVLAIALPVLIAPLPFYAKNVAAIVAATEFLASARVASVYGLGGGMELKPTLRFITDSLRQYEFLICVLASVYAIKNLVGARASKTALVLIAASTLVPFLIVALSEFKQPRYAYPGFSGLFVLAGYGCALMWTRFSGATAVAILLLFPLAKVGVTYNLVPGDFITRAAALQVQLGLQNWGLLDHAPPPDRREWRTKELVEAIRGDGNRTGIVVLVGGSPTFHPTLLRFTSLTMGYDQTYTSFSFQAFPRFPGDRPVANDLLKFVESQMPGLVVCKTPPHDPLLGQYADDVMHDLDDPARYARRDLSIVEPDGSRYVLYTALQSPIEVLQRNSSHEFPPQRILYNFADRYVLESVEFKPARFGMVASLTWHRIGPPLPNEAIAFHLLDANGTLERELGRKICTACADPLGVARWIERFYLEKDRLKPGARIGIAVYTLGAGMALKGSGGPSDWDGRRALFDVPSVK
jgi:4-amino-4-deoxy-L-arabinose transferase-like glycosyltransferase